MKWEALQLRFIRLTRICFRCWSLQARTIRISLSMQLRDNLKVERINAMRFIGLLGRLRYSREHRGLRRNESCNGIVDHRFQLLRLNPTLNRSEKLRSRLSPIKGTHFILIIIIMQFHCSCWTFILLIEILIININVVIIYVHKRRDFFLMKWGLFLVYFSYIETRIVCAWGQFQRKWESARVSRIIDMLRRWSY